MRRIELDYEVRGMLQRISSSDSATVGSGNVVNEVKFAYNGYGQPITAWQAHAGAVDTMTSPKVQYTYVNDPTKNWVRPTSLVYPNGRTLTYDYGTAGGIDDSASRIASIIDSDTGSTHLADYDYLGLGTVAIQSSPEPGLECTLLGSLTADGDIYTALDRFGRIKQSLWKKSSTALSDVQYGYNRASSRIWRKNPTDSGNHFDWAYGHDGLHRLKQGERGTLSGTSITSKQFAQCWTLDATGNWEGFRQDDNGNGTWDLNQTRTANEVNEITGITDSVGPPWLTPVYDANGNMTAIPTGQAPADVNWPTFTADEWSAFTPDEWAGFVVGSSLTGTYDAWNRLVKLADESNTLQENEYDGRGFRVVKKAYSGGTLDETRHYYFSNSWQVLEERVDATTTPDRHYVWGIRYIDDLILRDRTTTSTLDERLYAMQDGNWNVTTVANASGTVQERYEYDPYGNTTFLSPTFTSRSGSDYDWETLYAGYRWDASVGLFQVRFRWYSPVVGTWLTRDPIGYYFATNLAEYVLSSPSDLIDPLGLQGEFNAFFDDYDAPETLAITFVSPGEMRDYGFSEAYRKGNLLYLVPPGPGQAPTWWSSAYYNATADVSITYFSGECGYEWRGRIPELRKRLSGRRFDKVVFAGHGGTSGFGGYVIKFDNLQPPNPGDPPSGEIQFLQTIGEYLTEDAEVQVRACSCVSGQDGEAFVQRFADTIGARTSMLDDYYIIRPHGNEYCSNPGDAAPTIVARRPRKDETLLGWFAGTNPSKYPPLLPRNVDWASWSPIPNDSGICPGP